jgi:hypothetical protein
VSGVWIRARKLEGELDVEQRRIVRLIGESIVVTAEPAWFGTSAKPNGLPIDLRYGREGERHFAGVGRFHCSLT